MIITYSETTSRFEAATEYEERAIPKAARFRWDPTAKCWWTDNIEHAAKLVEYADETAAARLAEVARKREAAIAASRATDAEIDLPAPEGLDYLPYQRAGIAYALGRDATLIGDEMGLGKTIQAIGVINADPSIKTVCVICPASLRLNWKRELHKWLTRELSVGIAISDTWPAADVVIINYDIIKRHRAFLTGRKWDLLIIDEAHYLKNPKAQRTKLVLGSWHADPSKRVKPIEAARRVMLTGTPMVNRPIELWPLVKSLDPQTWRSWKYYVTRYCDGHQGRWGWDVSGATNLDELQEKLRISVMVRRLKKDVLTELPAKRRQVIEIPANGASATVKAEASAWATHEEAIEELRVAVELSKASDDPADYQAAIEKLREGMRVAFTEISTRRHAVALAKVPMVVEHVRDAIESSGKVVVFAHHRDVVEELASELGEFNPVVLTGDTPMQLRQDAVDTFQDDPGCQVFIGNLRAAGVGLTLTAASHVVFAELDWVPGTMSQAEDRCHRIGQQESVLVQHLVLDGSLDATMAHALVEKQAVLDAGLDVVASNEPVVPGSKARAPATAGVSIESLPAEAQALAKAPEVIEAIHRGLKELAAYCDGAIGRDGMGFNKLDTRIGHSLAGAAQLTPKQAVLGKRLVLHHQRQLSPSLIEIVAS